MLLITRHRTIVNSICGLLFPVMLGAAETPVEEGWPDDDGVSRALQVNEGELRFIAPILDRPVLHADTHLRITAESLKTGWVNMEQCYRQLDAIGSTDVVYAYREIRDLQVTHTENITQASVKQHGVELRDVAQGAVLCVQADVKILQHLSNGAYAMQNGPYHRKFLDGYYPYHLSLTVQFPHRELKLKQVVPKAQDGFVVTENKGSLAIDSWFEGQLNVGFEFIEP